LRTTGSPALALIAVASILRSSVVFEATPLDRGVATLRA